MDPHARESETTLEALAARIRACRVCAEAPIGPPLPQPPRPILRVTSSARLLVASQAPGIRAHTSGTPFEDPSGERLRAWMGIGREVFYDATRVAIAPMGFCFPGHDAQRGDLPPRRECRQVWHDALFGRMPQVETVLAIGAYAQSYHFGRLGRSLPKIGGLTAAVRTWRDHAGQKPVVICLPHPSWRNSGWLKRNPWFEAEVLPALRAEVARLTAAPDNSD